MNNQLASTGENAVMRAQTDHEEHDAPWLVVPFVLMLVLSLGLLLIAGWSLG